MRWLSSSPKDGYCKSCDNRLLCAGGCVRDLKKYRGIRRCLNHVKVKHSVCVGQQ